MARINIEDSLFKDPRFIDLCIHYGDKQKALGTIVWAFVLAQKHYSDISSDRLIPLSEWKRSLSDGKLIDLGFAELREKGVYVCGSEKQFAWLVQRQEAGKKGGDAKSSIRKKRVAVAKRELTVAKPLTLTPSLSPTLTPFSSSNSEESPKPQKIPADESGGSRVWISYRDAFMNRYGVEPVRNAKTNSLCSQLHKRLGEEACNVVTFYLTHNDGYYLRTQHALTGLIANAESLHTQWKRGATVTSANVREAEKAITRTELAAMTFFGDDA